MRKHVVDVGNCGPDFAALRRMLESRFACDVTQCQGWDDAQVALAQRGADLVLVNRKLDYDYSDGIEVIRRLKADPQWAAVPVMLVTNYAEHQQLAMAEGAEEGFGKLALDASATHAKLAKHLAPAGHVETVAAERPA